MLHQPLRGLDGFPLVPRYKPPQMLGVNIIFDIWKNSEASSF